MPVYMKTYFRRVNDQLNIEISIANRLIIEDIHRQANKITPLALTAQLRGNVKKTVQGRDGIIEWRVPYASYQERGSRYDGSHVVRHYTTPGTGKEFAKKSVNKVLMNVAKYYDQIGL